MPDYVTDIEEKTLTNDNFREVLNTTSLSQLLVMTLQPGERIGMEVYCDIDQFLRIEAVTGKKRFSTSRNIHLGTVRP